MRLRRRRRGRLAGALLVSAGALLAGVSASLAQQRSGICVVCAEPSASYACVVAEADEAYLKRGGERAVHFVCVTELAKLGGHASCRVRRDFSAHCDAPPRVVSLKGVVEPAPATAGGPPAGDPAAGADPKGPATAGIAAQPGQPEGPPQTLEELAKRTAEGSGDALKKTGTAVVDGAKSAGSAVGGAIKQTGTVVVDGAKSAGSAVGGALKQTWTCVTSLFTSCKKPE